MGADAVCLLSGTRRALRSIRTPSGGLAFELRARTRLHRDGARTDGMVAVRRARDFRRYFGELLNRERLYRRRNTTREARWCIRNAQCGVRARIRPGTGTWWRVR